VVVVEPSIVIAPVALMSNAALLICVCPVLVKVVVDVPSIVIAPDALISNTALFISVSPTLVNVVVPADETRISPNGFEVCSVKSLIDVIVVVLPPSIVMPLFALISSIPELSVKVPLVFPMVVPYVPVEFIFVVPVIAFIAPFKVMLPPAGPFPIVVLLSVVVLILVVPAIVVVPLNESVAAVLPNVIVFADAPVPKLIAPVFADPILKLRALVDAVPVSFPKVNAPPVAFLEKNTLDAGAATNASDVVFVDPTVTFAPRIETVCPVAVFDPIVTKALFPVKAFIYVGDAFDVPPPIFIPPPVLFVLQPIFIKPDV
jgi:hypothetical protein